MDDFAIIGDASCDLSAELRRSCGIEYLPAHVIFPDGTEGRASFDWGDVSAVENCDAEKFYRDLKRRPDGYKTSPANAAEWEDFLEGFAQKKIPALVVSISQVMSGSYNFIVKARERVLSRHPDAKIFCVDSMRFSAGEGLILLSAAEMRQKGLSIEQTVEFVEKNKNRFHQMGWMDDMSFLVKKGRISPVKSFFATIAGVKVFGEFDRSGRTTPIGKIASEKKAFDVILSYIEKTVECPEGQTILIAQTDRRRQAERLAELVRERFSPQKVEVCDVFPYSGINVGPGLMAAYYMGREISADLSQEKALMSQIISKAG